MKICRKRSSRQFIWVGVGNNIDNYTAGPNTVGIWISTIWIPETIEYQIFWSSDFKWFGIQMVGL